MASQYINSFCFASEISEFLDLNKEEWLNAMIENYSFVTPYELSDEQIVAWSECHDVLQESLSEIVESKRKYGSLTIIFEYVLWDFDNENGVRPDVIILSKNRVGIIEFKTRSINDDNYKYVTSQAKKYRHRLLHNHLESKDMKIGTVAVITSMKDYYKINGRVKCVSPDRLIETKENLMGVDPKPHPDVNRWINSDYVFPVREKTEEEERN
ncbi:MAG: hypothetical protein IJI66_04875 [Erysipelotrichaceae bacterium]|nr:hypothetical protein [Erysipelotrichaceae bacterium]